MSKSVCFYCNGIMEEKEETNFLFGYSECKFVMVRDEIIQFQECPRCGHLTFKGDNVDKILKAIEKYA